MDSRAVRWWQAFNHLDAMFPSRRWARAYLVGLGGYWATIAATLVLTGGQTQHPGYLLMIPAFAFGAVPIGTWIRWLWLNRRSASGFVIAYLAGINFISQVNSASRVAEWDWRRVVPPLLGILVLDIVLMVVPLA